LVLSKSCDTNNRTTWWTFFAAAGGSYQIKAADGNLALSQGAQYTTLVPSDATQTSQQWNVQGGTDPSSITSITSKADGQAIGLAPGTGEIASANNGKSPVIRLSKVRVHVMSTNATKKKK
jgi:hypothetical protein